MLAPFKKKSRSRIWNDSVQEVDIIRPPHATAGEFEIVIDDDECKEYLQFARRKETSGTGRSNRSVRTRKFVNWRV